MWIDTLAKRPVTASLLALFTLLALYLGLTAPAALPDAGRSEQRIPAAQALAVLNRENAAIRALYTGEIVGPGQKVGLKFDEHWKSPEVLAGPLPALLLRETAKRLQARQPELGLFLGSDHPIVKENLFKGEQARHYEALKRDLQPRDFYDPQLQRTTAMFADLASAQACVSCHNEHPNSPKQDWQLREPMGATTWSYAGQSVTLTQLLQMVQHLRGAAVDAYASYLKKTADWDEADRPLVGSRWPREGGRYLPDETTFRQTVEARTSPDTLRTVLRLAQPPGTATAATAASAASAVSAASAASAARQGA